VGPLPLSVAFVVGRKDKHNDVVKENKMKIKKK
jgi:hypothetical protein